MQLNVWRSVLIAFGVVFMLVLLSTQAIISAIIPQTVEQLTKNSTDIINGTVISQKSQWNDSHNLIYTIVTISVIESFKGDLKKTSEILVWLPGGQVGDTGLAVEHAANFENSQGVILFLTKIDNYYDVTSWEQGKYTIIDGIIQEKNIPISNFVNEIKSNIK